MSGLEEEEEDEEEEEEEDEEEEEEGPEMPSMNLFLQKAVYALMAELDIQINPSPPLESQPEPSRNTIRSIRIIGPALPLKKRSFESIRGADDSEENEKKKKKYKKEDEKPRRESAEDSEENVRRKRKEDQEPRSKTVEHSLGSEENMKENEKPRTRRESAEDSKENVRKKREDSEENVRKKQKEEQEPRSETVKDSLESEEKMEEDDQEPRTEPAQDENENKERKSSCEQAEDSQKNESKKQEDDQGPRIEPAVQDSQEDKKMKKEDDAAEGSQRNEIGEEDLYAAHMLLTFVARFIDFWRRLNHYDEPENSPGLPPCNPDYSPALLLYDFHNTPAMPFNLNDEHDDYREPTMAEGLGDHLVSMFFDTKAQMSFLKILSEYMNVNYEEPFGNRTIPVEFITDWFPETVRVSDVYSAYEFLEMKHKEKLRQIKEKLDYWDQYEQIVYEYGSMIWGRGDDDFDSSVPDETTGRSPIGTRSTGVKIWENNESQIAQNVTETKSPVEDFKEANWTHLDTEIAIFDRVIGYKSRNGRNPFPDNNDLADFIKNWLQIDVPVKEFNELITCLKKKYAKRAGKRPLNVSCSDVKDEKVLHFARKIWE